MAEESKESKALSAAVEAVKFSLALATGTLVFSAELLKEEVRIGPPAKVLLAASWCILGISIVAGVLAYLRVPVMISEDKPGIHDKWFEWPGRIHHVAFLLGVAILGLAMICILLDRTN